MKSPRVPRISENFSHFAQVLKERYHLAKLPLIINGAISGQIRQSYVDEFQSEEQGFNVIIISPKVGGVGLTLTAANNVVHLNAGGTRLLRTNVMIGLIGSVKIKTQMSLRPCQSIQSLKSPHLTLFSTKSSLRKDS